MLVTNSERLAKFEDCTLVEDDSVDELVSLSLEVLIRICSTLLASNVGSCGGTVRNGRVLLLSWNPAAEEEEEDNCVISGVGIEDVVTEELMMGASDIDPEGAPRGKPLPDGTMFP